MFLPNGPFIENFLTHPYPLVANRGLFGKCELSIKDHCYFSYLSLYFSLKIMVMTFKRKVTIQHKKLSSFLGEVGDYKNHFTEEVNEKVNLWIETCSKKYPDVKFDYVIK